MIPPAVTTLHKRIAAGAALSGPRPHLPPAGLVIFVGNATKSRYGPLLGALATLARLMLSGCWGGGHWPMSMPSWWDLVGNLTCWSSKQVRRAWSRAWPSAWLARRTLGLGGTPSAGAARERARPTNPT